MESPINTTAGWIRKLAPHPKVHSRTRTARNPVAPRQFAQLIAEDILVTRFRSLLRRNARECVKNCPAVPLPSKDSGRDHMPAANGELTFDAGALARLSSAQEDSVAARLHGTNPVLVYFA